MRSLRPAVQSPPTASDDMRGPGVPCGEPTAHQGVVRRQARGAGQESSAVCAVVPGSARWKITDHAVHRYRQRCPGKRNVSLAGAVSELTELSAKAHYVKTLESGLELWRCGKPWRLRFRVLRSSGPLQLVTVLRGCDGPA